MYNKRYRQRRGQKIHCYKINGNLNSTIKNNIINDHKCKTNCLLAIQIYIKSTKGIFIQINQQNGKPTYINAKRTDINIKQAQADAQKWRILEKQLERCPVKSYTDHLVHRSSRIEKSTRIQNREGSFYNLTQCFCRLNYVSHKWLKHVLVYTIVHSDDLITCHS